MTRSLLAVVLGAAVYLIVLGSVDPWDALAAVAIAAACVASFRRHLFDGADERVSVASIVAFVPFLLAAARAVLHGIWQVTRVVVGLAPLRRAGIVVVPIGERRPGGVAATGLTMTLSPGEVLVDVDAERGVMLVHAIDASDPDAIRAEHEWLYRRQRRVFP